MNLCFSDRQWLQLGQPTAGPEGYSHWGWHVKISEDGNSFVAAAPSFAVSKGVVKVFYLNASKSWEQKGSDLLGKYENSKYGSWLDISGDGSVIAISAYDSNNYATGALQQAGYMEVFAWDGNDWLRRGEVFDGTEAGSTYGSSCVLSTDGNTVAFSKWSWNSGSWGSVEVYEWNSVLWVQKGFEIIDRGPIGTSNDLGKVVAISGDGSVVAASDNNGWVVMYEWSASESDWVKRGGGYVLGDAETLGFGSDIQLSYTGTVVAATSQGQNDNNMAAHAKVWEWNGIAWIQKGQSMFIAQSLFDDTYSTTLQLGMSSDGTFVALGHSKNPDNKGFAILYKWDSTSEMWITVPFEVSGLPVVSQSYVSLSSDANRIVVGYVDIANTAGMVQVRVFFLMYFSHVFFLSAAILVGIRV